ncbi:CRISPR-associated protein Cas4 [Candidatus Desantisbacteria bacterium]|nr:CRISPR-associated protein Cas4 [Candidatus Desantisbacteria bacterium]
MRNDVRIERGMPLRSTELGLNGKADVVEFHKDESGCWIPFPVEYKRGKPKMDDCDKIQLCAQALCLEEMLNVKIPSGALFYGKTRHRFDVEFDDALCKETKDTAVRLHDFIDARKTPKPVYMAKCDSCSFFDICMPKAIGRKTSVVDYLKENLKFEICKGDIMTFDRFENVPVWQDGIKLTTEVFKLIEDKRFRFKGDIANQIQRAALSIPNNIAEGFERGTTQELIAFLYYARGSAGEVRSILAVIEQIPVFDDLKSEIFIYSNKKRSKKSLKKH